MNYKYETKTKTHALKLFIIQANLLKVIEARYNNITANGVVGPSDFIQNIKSWKCSPAKKSTMPAGRRSLVGRSVGEHCANVCTHGLHCCSNTCSQNSCPGHVACEVGSTVTLGMGQLLLDASC